MRAKCSDSEYLWVCEDLKMNGAPPEYLKAVVSFLNALLISDKNIDSRLQIEAKLDSAGIVSVLRNLRDHHADDELTTEIKMLFDMYDEDNVTGKKQNCVGKIDAVRAAWEATCAGKYPGKCVP